MKAFCKLGHATLHKSQIKIHRIASKLCGKVCMALHKGEDLYSDYVSAPWPVQP